MIQGGRHSVLGVKIDAVDYESAVQRIIAAAKRRQPFAVSALAVHGVMTGALDRIHRFRLNQLDMLVPDGQPVRWALNRLHDTQLPDRVYGPTLMLKICEHAAEERIPVFFFGGNSESLKRLSENLCGRYPGLIVAGMRPSLFRRMTITERDEMVSEIRSSGAAITFVGIGCPRQEVWTFEFREKLAMPLIAVGAAFSFHAGELAQAPAHLQASGLEWCFRLLQEPRRLWKRYLLLNPLYATMLLAQWLRVYDFDNANLLPPTEELLYG